MDAGFNLTQAYQAGPFIGGSLQDAKQLGFIYQAAPFMVASGPAGATSYTMDSLGRLTQITFYNGTTVVYSYDSVGNRTSVVTTCGPGGC